MKLKNKIALVTGGSRGMGAAIAKQLAKDGAKVAITYSASLEKAEQVIASVKAAGGEAIAIKANSAIAEEVRNAIAETVKRWGRLDVLVNNAGVFSPKTLDESSIDDYNQVMDVNARGVFVATQEAARHMKEGGRIINIGSVVSDYSGFAGAGIYAMSKGAVAGLTRGLARELGPRGITINNVQPGPIDTDMNPANSEFADSLTEKIAIGRYGRSEEISSVVSFLASPEASFLTGGNYLADGGYSA